MNKKFPIALATALILANGASVAMAQKVSDESTTTSTTVPVPRGNKNPAAQQAALKAAQQAALRAAQKAAQEDARARYQAAVEKYREAKKLIITNFQTAMTDAAKGFEVARKSATTKEQLKAAIVARETAKRIAVETKDAALKALGAPPAKP